MKKIIFIFLFILLSLIIALISGEVLLRLAWSGKPRNVSYREITVKDKMVGYRFVPNSSKTVVGIMNNYKTIVKINSHGFRGRNYTYDKESNIKRILLFGDSETFGQGVDEQDMLNVVMEKQLNTGDYMTYEVINLSMPGTGTLAQEQIFIHDGLKYSPDIVIFFLTSNDLIDNVNYVTTRKKQKAGPRRRSSYIKSTHLYAFVKWQLRPYFLRSPLLRKILLIFYNPSTTEDLPGIIEQWYTEKWINDGLPLMKDSFERINSLSKKNNIELIIAVTPNHPQFNKNYEELLKIIVSRSYADKFMEDPQKPQRIIKEFCKSRSIHYIELLDDFRNLSQNSDILLKHVHDGHLNKRGTLEIARILIRELRGL